ARIRAAARVDADRVLATLGGAGSDLLRGAAQHRPGAGPVASRAPAAAPAPARPARRGTCSGSPARTRAGERRPRTAAARYPRPAERRPRAAGVGVSGHGAVHDDARRVLAAVDARRLLAIDADGHAARSRRGGLGAAPRRTLTTPGRRL